MIRKMELNLSILSAYLPYKAKILIKSKNVQSVFSETINLESNYIEPILNNLKNQDFKLLLNPLSDFNFEEKKYRVQDFVGHGNWCDMYDDFFESWSNDACNRESLILQAPYPIFSFFLANHYDVFGLLKHDLAIEKTNY